ncbi:hypothetical protein EHE19_016435 [Ruminiclostridium herbifermentans]|uniref:Uncharacterized protein n=1 Tax=Ruminiclostridium herbifermentans TaxID=2488810 RepID=A0A4U7J8F6_9FIRM|nr:hypothetical protein [Ruminiclostridium herbifermentans]QNU66432.1 hypothetical protein EHE19_016435 [Ruminiclostridium herbifermentans]
MEKVELVNEIFKKRINIDFEENKELQREKLLGNKIGCPVRELVLILYDLEQCFGAERWRDSIINNRFDTYENIIATLNT